MRSSTQIRDNGPFGGRRSVFNNSAYSIFTSSETRNVGGGGFPGNNRGNTSRHVNFFGRDKSGAGNSSFLHRSVSADNVIVHERGFKPSDLRDPAKRNFIENLTSKILHFDMESGNSTPINLQKLLTPATDANEITHVKNKKMYASSYFYAPTHPTVEDQVELARRISNSLSDVKNVKSKGQSMYVNRKKRSVKWIHDGNGIEDEEETSVTEHREKVPLKCMMNPSGKVLDIHGIQALGEEVNIQTTPQHPERLFDIVRDLNTQKGRGAEIFAKRRKRSEKWVVDTEQSPSPSVYTCVAPCLKKENETSKFDNKPFYNPYTVDISMDYSTPSATSCALQHQLQCSHANFSSAHSDCNPCHTEVKKIYLREVAVGTEPEFKSSSRDNKMIEKMRRMSVNDLNPRGANNNHNHRSSNSSSNGYGRSNRNKTMQNGNHHHLYQPNNYQTYQASNNGFNNHHHYGYNNRNGHSHRSHHSHSVKHSNGHYQQNNGSYSDYHPQSNGYQNTNGYQNGNGYPNGNGYQNGNSYQNSNGYQNNNGHHKSNGYQNSNGHQNSNGCHTNGHQDHQSNGNDEIDESIEEDYTPVPVKQLIQEFEKTCRPVMQFKQYTSRVIPVPNNQNDISRFFEARQDIIYNDQSGPDGHQQQYHQHNQYRGNSFVSSGDEENDDEDDDSGDEDESLDDSLSPMDFYRIDDRRLTSQTNTINANRSSSMSTVDEYYRRQQTSQYQSSDQIEEERNRKKNTDSEAEVPSINKTPVLAVIASQDDLIAQKKHLKNTPVLENLVAGTTTPQCFKKEFTEEVAGKLYDNTYQGPKISSYQNLTNYNTAPRGWDQSQPIYRPIRFEKQQDNKIVYSDF